MSQASRTAAKLVFVASPNSATVQTATSSPAVASTSSMNPVAMNSTSNSNAAKAVHPFFAKRKRDEEVDFLSEEAEPSAPAPKRLSNEPASTLTFKIGDIPPTTLSPCMYMLLVQHSWVTLM